MKKFILIAFVLLLGACKEEVARVGEPAPEIATLSLQGQPVKLANWKGQNIYLNFWSAGCGICIAEMKDLERLSKDYQGKVAVVSVNVDPEEMSIDGILEKQGITYPVLRDSLRMTRERYRIIGTPTAFMISPDGVIRKMFLGAQKPEALATLFADTAKGSIN
jgi:Peroxiredoxin